MKIKISVGILTLVCLVILLFAFEIFTAANNGRLMPMMEESIGKTTGEIKEYSPELLALMLMPVKITAVLMLSLVTGVLILVYSAYRKRQKWAAFAIYFMLLLWLLPAVFIYSSQTNAPWQVWLVLSVLVIVALILYLTKGKVSGTGPE